MTRPREAQALVAWLPVAAGPAGVLVFYDRLQPWALMWGLAISIYFGLKWLTWWKARAQIPHAGWRSLAYVFAWPGMDAPSFLDETKGPAAIPRSRDWIWAGAKVAFGASLLWIVARTPPAGQALVRGWVGMLGLIFLLHFGTFELAALSWEAIGIDAQPIMSAPLSSSSLSEFWGRRWNLGFRQLAHDLVFAPLHKRFGIDAAGFAVFVLSGVIHDLVISVPARGGYGLPTVYFTLQGLGVMIERSRHGRKIGLGRGGMGRLFMALFTLGPLFWLFHPPFVLRVIIPFMKVAHAL